MKPYPETHQKGHISLENLSILNFKEGQNGKMFKGDLGVQISEDGRVWICIDGIAFLRFKPEMKKENPK